MTIILTTCFLYLAFHTTHVESLRGQRIKSVANEDLEFVISFIHVPTGEHVCTGVLITKSHVLTAEHCLHNIHPKSLVARIRKTGVEDRAFAAFETYDNWASASCAQNEFKENDIGIALLANPIERTIIKPAILSYNLQKLSGKADTEVLGWKKIRKNNKSLESNELYTAKLVLLAKKLCEYIINIATGTVTVMPGNWLCAYNQPPAVLEEGDSGAPILDSNRHLIGVNIGECPLEGEVKEDIDKSPKRDYYIVNAHTSIHYYKDFIEKTTLSAFH